MSIIVQYLYQSSVSFSSINISITFIINISFSIIISNNMRISISIDISIQYMSEYLISASISSVDFLYCFLSWYYVMLNYIVMD